MTGVIDTPEGIEMFRLLALKGALKLVSVGLKVRNVNAAKMVREMLGVKTRDKKQLLEQYIEWLEIKKAEY